MSIRKGDARAMYIPPENITMLKSIHDNHSAQFSISLSDPHKDNKKRESPAAPPQLYSTDSVFNLM